MCRSRGIVLSVVPTTPLGNHSSSLVMKCPPKRHDGPGGRVALKARHRSDCRDSANMPTASHPPHARLRPIIASFEDCRWPRLLGQRAGTFRGSPNVRETRKGASKFTDPSLPTLALEWLALSECRKVSMDECLRSGRLEGSTAAASRGAKP
jgi:hypothetical protein